MLSKITKFKERNPVFWEAITTLLVLSLGILIGHGLNVNDIQDTCNDYIMSDILTEDVQYCLLETQGLKYRPDTDVILINWSGNNG